MIECAEHRGETDAMASCPRCLILYWEFKHNALRAENERLRSAISNAMVCLDHDETGRAHMRLRGALEKKQ